MKALGIDQLTIAQRILLVEEIRDSIAAAQEPMPITEAQKQDLQRRLAAREAHPRVGSTGKGGSSLSQNQLYQDGLSNEFGVRVG